MINRKTVADIAAIKIQDQSADETTCRLRQWSLRFKPMILTSLALLMLSISAFNTARAVEPLASAELELHRAHYRLDSGGKNGIFCGRNIQGFIDGAVAADEGVTLNISDEYEREKPFSERAIEIRLGNRLENCGSSDYAVFCLGDPTPKAEVVQKVVFALKQPGLIANNPLTRDIVYGNLCKRLPL